MVAGCCVEHRKNVSSWPVLCRATDVSVLLMSLHSGYNMHISFFSSLSIHSGGDFASNIGLGGFAAFSSRSAPSLCVWHLRLVLRRMSSDGHDTREVTPEHMSLIRLSAT